MFYHQVGGEFFDTVIPMMNTFGRVSLCGQISSYNKTEPDLGMQSESSRLFCSDNSYSLHSIPQPHALACT